MNKSSLWDDFKAGIREIRSWRFEDWKRYGWVFAIPMLAAIWYIAAGIHGARQVDERPLYQRSPGANLSIPGEPFLVEGDEVSNAEESYLPDDVYKFFLKEGSLLSRALNNENVDGLSAETIAKIEKTKEEIAFNLPDGVDPKPIDIGSVTLERVEDGVAEVEFALLYSYGDEEDQYSVVVNLIFAEAEDKTWKLDQILTSIDSADEEVA